MKALHILKVVLKDTIMSREKEYINEAIKELEYLNNRNCESCKHFEETYCNIYEFEFINLSLRDEHFCCNKWEEKC